MIYDVHTYIHIYVYTYKPIYIYIYIYIGIHNDNDSTTYITNGTILRYRSLLKVPRVDPRHLRHVAEARGDLST